MEFYTAKELSVILKISIRTVIRLIETEQVKASKVGREWRVERKDLENYLNKKSNLKVITWLGMSELH